MFVFKKISNYISFINHLYRNNKKCNIPGTLGCIFVFKGPYQRCKIAYLDDIASLDFSPYGLHFSEVMSFTKIITDVDG